MSRPASSYAEDKAKVRAYLEAHLRDVAEVQESVSLGELRKLFHHKGKDFFLDVVLRDMAKDGLVEVWREGRAGIVYLKDKFLRGANADSRV